MVKQKTIEDPNKEIWLLRVPSSISLDAVNNLPIAKEQGDVGAIVARSRGAARDHGGPVGRAFGGDIVIREESALADDMRPLVKTRSGSLRCAGAPVSRQLSLAVEHDPATTEMDAGKYVPAIVAPAVESVWSKDPIGEELLGKDFAEKTGYIHPIWSRSAYNGKLQPRDVRARFFPNSTREPRDGSAPPGVVSSAPPTKKRKSDPGGSEKKKKKKKRSKGDDALSPGGSEKKKVHTAASYLPSMTSRRQLAWPRRHRRPPFRVHTEEKEEEVVRPGRRVGLKLVKINAERTRRRAPSGSSR